MTLSQLTSLRGVSAFSHRNYRLFFAGQLISLIGTWMQQVAQAWLVLQLTGDPLWLGIVAAAQFIPVMVFGLFGGVIADALPKRQTLIATQAAMMLLAVTLAVLTATGLVTVPMIVVLAFLLGCANAVDMPVRQAFAVEMVGREDIPNAVALNSAMFNGARIIGPAVAGLTIGLVGVAAAFAINALSFLAVIIGLLAMRDSELRPAPRIDRPHSARAVGAYLREGFDYVRGTPLVLLAVVVVGLVSTFGMNFGVVIPTLTQVQLQGDAAGYGFLMAASGVGSLLAALWLAFGRSPKPSRMAGGAIVLGVGEVLLGASRSYPLSLLLMLRGRVRGDRDGRDRQHHAPALVAGPAPWPGHELLHDDLRGFDTDRRPADGRHRVGGGHRDRDGGRRRPVARRGGRGRWSGPAGAGWTGRSGSSASAGAPKTSAAFRPPNPNDVERTRSYRPVPRLAQEPRQQP